MYDGLNFTGRPHRSFPSFGGYDTIRDTVLVGPLKGNFLASFAVGWACTTVGLRQTLRFSSLTILQGASLAAYPLDTIRRRMMMTSGEKVRAKILLS